MCFSFEVSLASGVFSWAAGFYLLNNRKLSLSQRYDVIFLLIFSSIQFVDAILWYIEMDKNWINFIATSLLIPAILSLEILFNVYIRNKTKNVYMDAFVAFTIVYMFNKFYGYSTSLKCNRISSPVWGSKELRLFEILIFSLLICYPRFYLVPVVPLIIFCTSGAFGSLWCAIANISSLYFLCYY